MITGCVCWWVVGAAGVLALALFVFLEEGDRILSWWFGRKK